MNDQTARKILVIDDEGAVRENIAAYLEDSEFIVFQAENGRVGMDLFLKEDPDVVLVDIDMPEMNGFEVLMEVKKQSEEVPVVFVSGAGEITNAIEASRLGAWDFVVKPIHNMAVVEHTIDKVLERRKLLRENREYKEDLELKVKERTASLEQKTEELLNTNEKLIGEIEERRLAEARLRQAKERSVALRRFSNKISEFTDEARLLETALEELCENIYLSGASLFHSFKSDQLTKFLPGKPPSDFLNKLPTFEFIRSMFNNRSQEIVVHNNLTEESPVFEFYKDQDNVPDDLVGSHFAFLRGNSLHHHVYCFYRDALYAPFYNLDIEYMKSMVNEINTAYGNIQVITANAWLERRLKSTIPADRANTLLETHEIPGYEVASSVYPSYEIKAEWHCVLPVDENASVMLMSDIPGLGMSDVMYNEMAAELLSEDVTQLNEPDKVMELLNDELQTDFHPNRLLTLNYLLIQHQEGIVQYNNLGHESMTLLKIDQTGHSVLSPQQSPFVQIYVDQLKNFFHQEEISLDTGEIILGFTQRMADMINIDHGKMKNEDFLKLIQALYHLPVDQIMEKIVLFMIDFFPKNLQKNDANLLLIKRL